MKAIFLVAAGGFLGAIGRFYLSNRIQSKQNTDFPIGTFTVNLLGSLLLGLLAGQSVDPSLYLLVGTGFLGAFTTFSTFELEAVELLRKNKVKLSLFYLLGSVMLGVLCAFLGYSLSKSYSFLLFISS
ncbi:camphor resistance protein CrcB [Desulforamulus reducens MI-1]|uniref:Fluoride-specific ion channel FluC n=1 Tax=Desulforamulus reducens (strain ATCC BAA-1160 / DSM 100696 / MI-1) TaxID=349161 RepID=A4J4K7_DESRM|nr:fluoride efflux transporter CrcB [Desulforamulus reducens]ABO50010.1 camphor resistance protein CrcB [Desulforamulus reducens MI-1]